MIGREGLHRQVLLDIARNAGASDVVSYISTGNLTFDLLAAELDRWIDDIEAGIEQVVGRRTEVFVRTIDALRELDAADHFARAPFAASEIEAREICFLSQPFGNRPELPIWGRRRDVVVFDATATELFAVNRLVDGRTSGCGGLVERTLGQRTTVRSASTIERILRSPFG